MQVTLKVVGGKNNGREIVISVARFIVGRGETAHLRPASDLVSREHCAIEIKDGKVTINDLSSRNGTFVNGEKITQQHVARTGDAVRIGRLQFVMVIDPVKAGAKKPKVASVVEAASRTVTQQKASLEDSISDWLLEGGDDDDELNTDERRVMANSETIQLNLDETTTIRKDLVPEDSETELAAEEETPKSDKKTKSKPMKLPPMAKAQHDSSTSAADDVLKKFFNRR
jgi:pSer/pThr/pTyr-binding forkhead associated (FHA) protein